MYIDESHGSESKENARFSSKENAERGSEGAKEREWVCDWCKCVFYESHGLESRNLTSAFCLTVSLRVRAIGGTILLVDFDQGRQAT